jgi:multidrug efflux system membrane fusion protein
MKRFLTVLLILVLAAGAGAYYWREKLGLVKPGAGEASRTAETRGGGRRGPGGPRGDAVTSVLTVASRYADVPVTLVAVGTAQALNTVTVRSQVDGRLIQVAFQEGQEVKKGDLIARIDPAIYQAQYDQAVAKKAQDEATLANARLDLTRYVNLAQGNYGSKQQADTQRATVAQLEAQVKSDQGAIDSAKTTLDYTTILAPIDGRTGIRVVDQGNIVKASDTTGLVTITQIRPITILFNLPQQNLRAVNAAAARGAVPVDAFDSDNKTVLDTGTLTVVDNQVDQTTGTVKLKATFPNAMQQLWPGQFVNVRLTVDTLKNAVTVPTAAVQRGPNGAFVYGIADDKAVLKTVEVGRQDETVSVITSGLKPPEQVITTGFARLTNGDRVRVAEANPDATTPPPAGEPANEEANPRAGRRQRPDGAGRPEGERRRRPQADGATGSTAAPAMPGGLPPSPPQGQASSTPGSEGGQSAAGAPAPTRTE